MQDTNNSKWYTVLPNNNISNIADKGKDYLSTRELAWLLNTEAYHFEKSEDYTWLYEWITFDRKKGTYVTLSKTMSGGFHWDNYTKLRTFRDGKVDLDKCENVDWPLIRKSSRVFTEEAYQNLSAKYWTEPEIQLTIHKFRDDWFVLETRSLRQAVDISDAEAAFFDDYTSRIPRNTIKCDGFVGLKKALIDFKLIKKI